MGDKVLIEEIKIYDKLGVSKVIHITEEYKSELLQMLIDIGNLSADTVEKYWEPYLYRLRTYAEESKDPTKAWVEWFGIPTENEIRITFVEYDKYDWLKKYQKQQTLEKLMKKL